MHCRVGSREISRRIGRRGPCRSKYFRQQAEQSELPRIQRKPALVRVPAPCSGVLESFRRSLLTEGSEISQKPPLRRIKGSRQCRMRYYWRSVLYRLVLEPRLVFKRACDLYFCHIRIPISRELSKASSQTSMISLYPHATLFPYNSSATMDSDVTAILCEVEAGESTRMRSATAARGRLITSRQGQSPPEDMS